MNTSNPNMAPAPPDGAVGTYDDDFNQKMLALHNSYRAAKGIPPLVINRYLAEQASLQAANGFFHQNCNGAFCGQNLCRRLMLEDCAARWYVEGSLVGYGCPVLSEDNFAGIGHYTQVMWKTSTRIGCAFNTSTLVIACNYNPPGNLLGAPTC